MGEYPAINNKKRNRIFEIGFKVAMFEICSSYYVEQRYATSAFDIIPTALSRKSIYPAVFLCSNKF